MASPPSGHRPPLARWLEVAALFGAMLVCYLGNGRTIWAWDTMANRFLPVALVRDRSFALDEFPFLYSGELPPCLKRARGHVVSFYPVTGAVLAIPFYAPAVWAGTPRESPRWERLEKRAAATIVALSVVVLFAALRRVTTPAMAWLAAVAYGLGGPSFSVAAQALWQHGPMQLGLALGLYALVRGREDDRWIALAGPALAFAAISRPSGFLVGAPFALYVLIRHPRRILPAALLAVPVLGAQGWYNAHYYGDVFWTQFPPFQGWMWRGRPFNSWAGLLFSPSRGLFVYSPVFAFSVAMMVAAWRPGGDALLRAAGAGVILVLAVYGKWLGWHGGTTFGPRLLSDLTPLLAFALHPLRAALQARPIVRGLFIATLLWSIAAHAIGAYWDDGTWADPGIQGEGGARRLWSWNDNQLVNPVAQRVKAVVNRSLGVPIPVGTLLERRRREQIAGEPWSDAPIRSLRDLYGDAQYGEGVAEMERLLGERFSPQVPLGWNFGGALTLIGYDWAALGAREFEVTYYWRAERELEESYFAFVHFEGDRARFQDDHALGVIGYGSERWHALETVKTMRRVRVPPEAPAGRYVVRLGVWGPSTGSHLRLRDGTWKGAKAGRLRLLDIGS
ncbi:MAG: glycosyltransferase family 39 protein [Candidatus Binatia bacterium]